MTLSSRSISLSIGLTSIAVIAFQLMIMQMLSISQWHHFAYMVISMAMLGFGAAGTFLALFREPLKRHFKTVLPVLYLLSAITMALSVRMVGIFGDFDAFLLFFDRSQIALMIFSYLVYCLPFFFAGLAITLVFYHQVGQIGSHYFFNLVGSALGALVIIVLFSVMELRLIPPVLALLPLAAAWLVRIRTGRFALLITAGFLISLFGFIYPVAPQPSEFKAIYSSMQLPDARITYERSGPYGLLQVVSAPAQRFAPALSLQYRGEPPVRHILFNNGEYFGTLLGRYTDTESDFGDHILDYTTRGLPYAVRRPASVLVLKSGTGNDVSHALFHGAGSITAVEPHRQANRLLKSNHPEWIDSIYNQPEVSLYGNSVRSWMAGDPEIRNDLIILPVLGAFGGTSGIYALQEQYHLTLEAFREYWQRLTPSGMVAVTVWTDYPPKASLKLLATLRTLLDEQGMSTPEDHIMAVRNWGTITFVMSRSPFTDEEHASARAYSRRLSFDPLMLSDIEQDERDRFNAVEDHSFFDHVDSLVHGSVEAFNRRYLFDTGPATDNRPFFSHYMTLQSIPELREQYDDRELPYIELGFILALVALVQIVLASVILIILPLFRVGWRGTRRRWTFLYFSGIGIGFMFFEMVLIQKLVLYLGQPVYATAAVLAALLMSSGAGSYYSSGLRADRRTLIRAGAVIIMLIAAYAAWMMPLLDMSMSWPLPVKIANVAVLLAPPAFFMGMMFPFGLRRLKGSNETQIPWACGVDSCLSVSATALATLVALESGFIVVMAIAAFAYGLTTIAALRIGEG